MAPANAQADFQKAVSLYKQGQFEKASIEFEALVKADPKYEAGFRILGDCYVKTRKYEKAQQSFRKAIELKEDNFVSHYGLAVAQFNLERYRDSITTLLRAERWARTPREQLELFQARGSAFFNIKDFQKAATDLERATAIQRTDSKILLQLGIAYFELERYAEARRYLEQTLAIEPSSAEATRYLSRVGYQAALQALESGKNAEALAFLQTYVAEHPGEGDAWYNLGLARLFATDLDGAEKAFLESSRILPSDWRSFDRLGFVYEKRKRLDASLEYYQKALSLNQDTTVAESVERLKERLRRQKEGS